MPGQSERMKANHTTVVQIVIDKKWYSVTLQSSIVQAKHETLSASPLGKLIRAPTIASAVGAVFLVEFDIRFDC